MKSREQITLLIQQFNLLMEKMCEMNAELAKERAEMAIERKETRALLNRILEKTSQVPEDTATSFKKMLTGNKHIPTERPSKTEEFSEKVDQNQLDRHAKMMAKLGL